MIGTLDQATYFARRTALEASIADAQAEFDQNSLAAELAGDLSFDVTLARANIQHLEDRLHSLDRAWVIAQERAAEAELKDREADRLAGVERAKILATAAIKAADEMQGHFDVLLESIRVYNDAAEAFRGHLTAITADSPHQRRTLDILSHNMVGPCILGNLRGANLQGLDDYEPIQAMTAFASNTPAGVAKERIRGAIRSASQDIEELKAGLVSEDN